MNDRESPTGFSRNWLLIFLMLTIFGMAALLLEKLAGPTVASPATTVGLAVIASFALADGGWRLLDNEGFLGRGRGFGRLLAMVQVLLAMGVLASLIT